MAAPWEAYQETKTEPSKQEGPWAKFSEEKTLAEKPFIERQKTAISPVTDVLNRALVAQTIGAPVDIATMAMRPFGYKTEAPVGGSEWIGKQMEKAGFVTPTRRPVAELLTGLSPLGVPAARAVAGMAKPVAGFITGKPVREAAQAAKEAAAGQYEAPISEAELARQKAARTIEQIERQPTVAAERAKAKELTPKQQAAELQAKLRRPTREKMAGKARIAEQRAAKSEEIVRESEAQKVAAQQAVDALDRQLVSLPGITAEQLGKPLRNATKKLQNDVISARAEGSNFKSVIEAAGDVPSINTNSLVSAAQDIKAGSRNPNVRAMMDEVIGLAKTGKQNALSLRSADSLRKYLSKDIINNFFPKTGADKETLSSLRKLRSALIKETPQEYKEALGKFSTLSRPLDIVERNGALKQVLDIDPISTVEKLTEAQVTGEIINKARQGHPVFSRLLEIDPTIKDSARLHFTQDLFGKGVAPSDSVFRNWLRSNERPLRQLGLYDEFKNIRSARIAAQRAVDEAKTAETVAKGVKTEAKEAAAEALKKSKLSESRLADALKTAEPIEKTLKKVPIQTFVQKEQKARDAAAAMRQMQSDINNAKKPSEIVSVVNKSAKDLYDRKIIDIDTYNSMKSEIQNVENLQESQAKARKIITGVAGLLGIGYFGRTTIGSILGGQ
jgi:hypothetical protein